MFGRGETWKIEFPSADLITAHERPICPCCSQLLPLRALRPVFLYCVGENCGYDPCSPSEVLKRWNDSTSSISSYVAEEKFVTNPMYVSKDIAELLLWCFGYPTRENMHYDVFKRAKDWLELSESTFVSSDQQNPITGALRYTAYRVIYARWAFKTVKIKLRAMKREGQIPTSATVR